MQPKTAQAIPPKSIGAPFGFTVIVTLDRTMSKNPGDRSGYLEKARPGLSHPGSGSLKAFFLKFLAGKNLKLTRQRRAVFDEIFNISSHFDADEIVQRLKNNSLGVSKVTVSRATVYRTLELLQECKLVERQDFGESGAFYEPVFPGRHHDHLICTGCGSVIEFHNEKLETMQTEICDKYEFLETHHSLHIFGLCNNCQQTTR